MFVVYADKNNLTVRQRERMTSGSVNAYDVRFAFSPEWEGMTKQAVFRAGVTGRPLAVPWTEEGLCEIPWEVMTVPGVRVYAGVYGARGETMILPTVWADLGAVLEGAVPAAGGEQAPPDDGLPWGIGHGLHVVDGELTVETTEDFSGDNTLPMSAAGVQATVGNIEILLGAI